MRLLVLGVLAALAIGGWYCWDHYPQARSIVENKVKKTLSQNELYSFKVRYTAENLMQTYKDILIRDSESSFLEPTLCYFPYLLMEIKFAKDAIHTQEGVLLWGLYDGEMVIDALSWKKTHGFEDCITSKANRDDFKILKTLIENGGAIDREKIYQKFKVETETVDSWLESCRKKKLIVVAGNKLRLHFQNPELQVTPMTQLDEWLVRLPDGSKPKIARRYNAQTIEQFAHELFGSDFVIRRMSEVYLPVYTLTVQNSDGSQLATRFNALSGKRLSEKTNGAF